MVQFPLITETNVLIVKIESKADVGSGSIIMQIAVINLNSISENYDLPSFNSRRRLTVIAWMFK